MHQGVRLSFGVFSCCSIPRFIACWISRSLFEGVLALGWILLISALMVVSIVFLCFWYLVVESVFLVVLLALAVGVSKAAYTAWWSAIGGEMVPAVTAVCVAVVSMTSMSVCVVGLFWSLFVLVS